MIAETFLEKMIRDQFVDTFVLHINIAKQVQLKTNNPLKYKHEIHKEGNVHKLTENEYEHAEQLQWILS